MTANPTDSPARPAAGTTVPSAEVPAPAASDVVMPSSTGPTGDPASAVGQIATLEPPPPVVLGVPDDPRTGEPRIPWVVRIASWLSIAAVAAVAGSLLWVYWDAVPRENFGRASWLMGQFVTEPGSLERVLLAVAVTVIALAVAVPLAITGYYARAGYRWSRVCAVVGAAMSAGTLTLNPPAWSAMPLAVGAAVLLWLPDAGRYFLAWHTRRHPPETFAPPTTEVFYGPLPRYR